MKMPRRSFWLRSGNAGYRVQGSSQHIMTLEYIGYKYETLILPAGRSAGGLCDELDRGLRLRRDFSCLLIGLFTPAACFGLH
jgi:hypothetical protein